jgi:hypothetical protein
MLIIKHQTSNQQPHNNQPISQPLQPTTRSTMGHHTSSTELQIPAAWQEPQPKPQSEAQPQKHGMHLHVPHPHMHWHLRKHLDNWLRDVAEVYGRAA